MDLEESLTLAFISKFGHPPTKAELDVMIFTLEFTIDFIKNGESS